MKKQTYKIPLIGKLLIGVPVIIALLTILCIVARLLGLLYPFLVPTGAMSPTVSPGDKVVVEGFTFLIRKPNRGEIIAFRTEGISEIAREQFLIPKKQYYIKRVAGFAGDQLQISNGNLYVNGIDLTFTNGKGQRIFYLNYMPASQFLTASNATLTVPPDCLFVLGDNSGNSLDSRFWGFLSTTSVIGRITFRFSPPNRIGAVK